MKLRASPSDADVAALDKFARAAGVESRFAAIQRASRLLTDANLEDAHEQAFVEWEGLGEADLWDVTASEGIGLASR
ncbi:hypothetical protein FB459_2844 [Yimella lutea]|uniref:Antitoxin n=1 Tax=Yimella lutea TaxID=587872 RepID=A0A542EIY1_9MICO|nr:antitoxin [Yimella lutea]TQJ15300.1 hypothetical protein FB459_2844 [Yimella lutea]